MMMDDYSRINGPRGRGFPDARRRSSAVISYADLMALREELEDLRAARRGQEILDRLRDDPDAFVPWEQVRAELIEDGLLSDE